MVRSERRAGAMTVPNFIGGRLEESAAGQVEEVPNPATGETIAVLPHSTPEEIDQVVEGLNEILSG